MAKSHDAATYRSAQTRSSVARVAALLGALYVACATESPPAPTESVGVQSSDVTSSELAPRTIAIIDATFDVDAQGFTYRDDAFRATQQPSYASGVRVSSGGMPGGALKVSLGGINANTIVGMSGGWSRTFHLDAPSRVTLAFQYNLTQSPNYENDEVSQVLVSVDGVLRGAPPSDFVAQLAGNGDGGPSITTGWSAAELTIGTLEAGDHTVVLGAFNSKKTAANEATDLLVDTVRLIATAESRPQALSCDTALCCPLGTTPVVLTEQSDTFNNSTANRCLVTLGGSDTIFSSGSGSATLGGAASDIIMAGPGAQVRGGDGDDTINGFAGGLVLGNAGNDTISAGNGTNRIEPGPGIDNVAGGDGADTVVINDLCEVGPGERLDGAGGVDTLVTPVPIAQLQALGVNVMNFENVVIQKGSCRSECSAKPSCPANQMCVDAPAGMACGCTPGQCPQPANTCLAAFCDVSTSQCLTYPKDGDPCADGNATTRNEVCLMGACVPPFAPTGTCAEPSVREEALRLDADLRAVRADFERFVTTYEARSAAEPEALALDEIVEIPVVFHVLKHSTTPEVSDERILAVLASVNDEYQRIKLNEIRPEFQSVAAVPRIQFTLARRDGNSCQAATGTVPGIIRYDATKPTYFLNSCSYAIEDPAFGGVKAWPTNKYLNIWIAPLVEAAGSAFLGPVPAGFPPPGNPNKCGAYADGVVLNPSVFLPNTGHDAHHIMTHEIGHWLGLVHTNSPSEIPNYTGQKCAGTSPATCAKEGDAVCDTPPSQSVTPVCTSNFNSCAETPEHNDMAENYMNSLASTCQSMFTAGQVKRMISGLTYLPATGPGRANILGSDGLIPPPAVTSDLWSRDGAGDVGEPHNLEVVWASDDIWVRRQVDGQTFQIHEDPVFRPGTPNLVYVRVRNRGCASAPSQNVTLYWAKSSTNLGWPGPWDGSVTSPALMGNSIGTLPTGTLGPGESKILEFSWEPPNPSDYASFGGEASHFCLLSQIGAVATTPQNLVTLVRNSNKMAWKNVNVATDLPSDLAAVTVQGTVDELPVTLRFTEPSHTASPASLFTWGSVAVDLGPGLFARWTQGGSQGTGIASVSGTTVTLAGAGATLAHIPLAAQDLFTLKVRFQPAAPASQPRRASPDVYVLDLTQLSETLEPENPDPGAPGLDVVGGQRFFLKTRAPLPILAPPPG